MLKLKDKSEVNEVEARKVLAALRGLQRSHPTYFASLVENARRSSFNYPEDGNETLLLKGLDVLAADRSIRGMVQSIIASAVEDQSGKLIIGSPFSYDD